MQPLALALLLCQDLSAPIADGDDPGLAAEVARILLREENPDRSHARACWDELQGTGAFEPVLFGVLADWQAPSSGEGVGTRLNEAQRALVTELVATVPRARWNEACPRLGDNGDPDLLKARLRLEGITGGSGSIRALYALAGEALAAGDFEPASTAFEEALGLRIERDAKATDVLRNAWRELDPRLAASALRALEEHPSAAVADCLTAWLGRRDELEAGLLLALGNMSGGLDPRQRAALALEVQERLSASDSAVVQAAATALRRLGTPATIPWLVEVLVHEDPAVQRAALGALREIGGVRLPGSSTAWRSWYAREETWFQEHAPALLDQLVAAEESEDPVAKTRALLRDLTEHRLHRDELAEHVRPLLAHERPRLRILACQALERLASRPSLAWLVAGLRDEDPAVVSAAHAALRTLEGVMLGTDPEPWCERLGLPLTAAGS